MAAAIALRASIAIVWINYLLTSRWASQPGSLHGGKEIVFVSALAVATILAMLARPGTPVDLRIESRALAPIAFAFLGATFLYWFPPAVWTQIPFQDDWATRYQTTIDQVARLRTGSLGGWQWAFLGGYHLSSDFTQSLGALAFIPVTLFGDAVGFHILHLLLFLAVPALVAADLSLSHRTSSEPELDRATTYVAAAIACVTAAGYSFSFIKSGDTNSLAGVAGALAGAHAAREHRRWGAAKETEKE